MVDSFPSSPSSRARNGNLLIKQPMEAVDLRMDASVQRQKPTSASNGVKNGRQGRRSWPLIKYPAIAEIIPGGVKKVLSPRAQISKLRMAAFRLKNGQDPGRTCSTAVALIHRDAGGGIDLNRA